MVCRRNSQARRRGPIAREAPLPSNVGSDGACTCFPAIWPITRSSSRTEPRHETGHGSIDVFHQRIDRSASSRGVRPLPPLGAEAGTNAALHFVSEIPRRLVHYRGACAFGDRVTNSRNARRPGADTPKRRGGRERHQGVDERQRVLKLSNVGEAFAPDRDGPVRARAPGQLRRA